MINSATGEPVRRALVQFTANEQLEQGQAGEQPSNSNATPGDRFALSDREGRFRFPGLPQVRGTLTAVKPGFFNSQEAHELRESGVLLAPPEVRALAGGGKSVEVGAQTPAVVLKLVPEAVIAGRIVDARGEPLEGVAIKVSSLQKANGRSQLLHFEQGPEEPRNLITNEDGEFRIAGLIAGTYYVAALPRQNHNQTQDEPPSVAYPVTYYPGVADFSQSTPIQLAAGEQAQVDFALKPVPVILVTGAVTGYPRGQQPDLLFVNQSGDDISFDKQFDAYTGRFQARVIAAGMCSIKGNAQDAAGHPLHGEVRLDLRGNAKNIVLALIPPPTIPITVQMETTQLLPGMNGPGSPANPSAGSIPAFVTLYPVEIGHSDVAASVEGGPGNPSLILRNIEPGEYNVDVVPSDASWYVKSILYGSADLFRQNLFVTEGQYSTMEIVLRDDGATLQGTVQSTGAGRQSAVLVVPDSAPLHPRVATTDDHGEFQVDGLAPGEYKVFAFDQLDGLDYGNPDALGEYASRAIRVGLQPNGKATVKVDLIVREES